MNITSVLRQELIVPDVRAKQKPDVIKELAGHIAAQVIGVDRDELIRACLERERAGTTAIGRGLAIPHCKLDSVTDLIACLGRSRKGVDFGAMDGLPTHFFFLLVSPPDAAGSHLKLLAQVSRLFGEASFRARLVAVQTAEEMQQIIAEAESSTWPDPH